MKFLFIASLVFGCQLLSNKNTYICYDYVRLERPIREFAIEELKVTKPVGESGVPLPDSTLVRVVCELDSNYTALQKIYFQKRTCGYKWKFEGLFNFEATDSLRNLSFEEKIAFVKKHFPIDSSKLGNFDFMPIKFKSGVWYAFTGLDEDNQGIYNVIFDSTKKAKIVYSTGPW